MPKSKFVTTGKINVDDLKDTVGFEYVSFAPPITDETDVSPIIVEVDDNGEIMGIVDGFHRANGYVAGGLETVTAIKVHASNLSEENLIAAAAVPEGYKGLSQDDALEIIYALSEGNPVPLRGATTAIQRRTPPKPLRWLHKNRLIRGRALDYGSGRQCWFGMTCYDPHWYPIKPTGAFDTITCNYVLNVVSITTQRTVLSSIHRLLKSTGTAYISVRRDLPKTGKAGRGTFQRYITLNLPSIKKTSWFEIYVMHK